MSSRTWNDYKPSKRVSSCVNPLRHWAEQVRPEIERKYSELHEKEGLTRPEQPLVFLMGDPTKYKGFETPEVIRKIAVSKVG